MARWDPTVIKQEVIASQRRRNLVARSLAFGQHAPRDCQPYRDASQQYLRSYMDLDDLERRVRFPAPQMPPPDHITGRS